ncbi:MAG: ABC transporter permease [Candidatus Caldarchaeum sp.]|nr:ABC transporter permease [Candidatus Caldarchaeum sp.]MCX8200856.1 ABC transporter permease [Candidatus Caldarchaeum sp.]MDW8063321.1 ABC transporter permease [Candidatus Caldarchaeum sp.]MDW8434821.1 ABC transporter permease [Candidatus Caldarchaeum sp.]
MKRVEKTMPRVSPNMVAVWRLFKTNPAIWTILGLVVIFSAIVPERFLSTSNLVAILRSFAVTAMLAVGPTFVILLGSIDLSFMGIWMFGGALVWLLYPYLGLASILVYPIFGLLVGLFNGVVHVKARIPSFILTLAVTAVFAFLTTYVRNVSGVLTLIVPAYGFLRESPIPYLPSPFLLSLPAIALALFLMFFTKIGTYLCAIGSNEEGAKLAGINVEKYKVVGFMISGFLTGLGSIAIFVHLGNQTRVDFDPSELIRGLAAIVLGGTPLAGGMGGPHRSLLGALIYVLIFNGLFLLPGVDPNHLKLYIGALLLGAVVIASKALKGALIT